MMICMMPKLVKNGKKRRHEDDRRQNGKRENESILADGVRQRPEDKRGAIGGVMEQLIDRRARRRHHSLAPVKFQHDQREEKLEANAPDDDPPLDSFAVCREKPARAQYGENSQNAGPLLHGEIS
jgi:hypothetical protein